MAMLKADQVRSISMLKLLPECVRGLGYVKPEEGMMGNIVHICYSVYAATANGNLVVSRDGKPVMRIVAYVVWSNATYSTFKGDTALAQLVSVTGEFPFDVEGTYDFDADEAVSIIMVDQAYGKDKKNYKVPAFAQ